MAVATPKGSSDCSQSMQQPRPIDGYMRSPPDGASTVVSNIDAESLNLSSLVILWLDNSYKIQTKLL